MVPAGQDESRSNPLEGEDFEEDDEVASLAGGGDDAADLDRIDELRGHLPEASSGEEKKALRGPPSAEVETSSGGHPLKRLRGSERAGDTVAANDTTLPLHEAT